MSDLIKNTELWDQVCKTDPRHTKKVNQRGGFTAIDAHYHFFVAAQFALRFAHDLGAPTLSFGVAAVHAQQIGCEQSGFITTCAGANF